MAKIEKFLPTLLNLEGGFVWNRNDRGGATNCGIILTTYQYYYGVSKTVNDLKHITSAEVKHIYKVGFWDKCGGDHITNQSVANLIVDWAVNSGTKTAIKKVQQLIGGLVVDGQCGAKTISAINAKDPQTLFNDIKALRQSFYNAIVRNNPSQRVFLSGWTNRLNSYVFL